MTGLAIIGGLVVLGFCMAGLWVLYVMLANIYGGISGAYRMHKLLVKHGQKRSPHWQIIRFGLKAWTGKRYRNGIGTYWSFNGMEVPLDGRDPIQRKRWFGA